MARGRYDYMFKVILVGDSGVGKTCLVNRFAEQPFDNSSAPTLDIDFKLKCVVIDGKRIKLQIWDTAGKQQYLTSTTKHCKGASGIVFVYDITSKESFADVENWIHILEEKYDLQGGRMIIGNKCDAEQQRQVSKESGQKLANEVGAMFMETSAKEKRNIEELFMTLARDIKVKMDRGGAEATQAVPRLTKKLSMSVSDAGGEYDEVVEGLEKTVHLHESEIANLNASVKSLREQLHEQQQKTDELEQKFKRLLIEIARRSGNVDLK